MGLLMTDDNTPKRGKPLPAHVLKKFQEKNAQTAFLSQVRKIIDDFNEHLESVGELRNRRLPGCANTIAEAVAEHFRKAGWTVTLTVVDDTCIFNIRLD